MENRSLNEFQNEESRDDAASAVETTHPPVTSTMDWTPDGAVCADCGEHVQRRWRDTTDKNERLVCIACKQWA